MEEARRVLERLDRIDSLRSTATADVLLDEVRALLAEAEAWVRVDAAGARAHDALGRVREALQGGLPGEKGERRTLVA